MIEIDGVGKRYGDHVVLDDISLRIETGELCVLLGRSGSGKSTLLKMVNRLVATDSGRIRIDGSDITALPVEALRRRIGYAIQSIGLFPHWNVERNIGTVPQLLGWERARIAARVEELLRLVQLDPVATRGKYPAQLSGGEQQRVGVARSLAADPAALLLDEPFGAVDPITRLALQETLSDVHAATGKTTLLVTHDIDEALRLADRIAIIDGGRLVQYATPLELLERPANDFVRDFIGHSEIALKLLSVRTAADRVRPDETAPGTPITAETPLREALAQMLLRRTDRLTVQARDGRVLGVLHLADLVDKPAE